MPDLPAAAVQAAAEAVRMHEWVEGSPWSIHAIHNFSGECAVCSGDINAIMAVALEAASPILAAQERADERRKVAEQIAAEIEKVIGGYPDNEVIRPRYERGGFLNDSQWSAQIARQIGQADD